MSVSRDALFEEVWPSPWWRWWLSTASPASGRPSRRVLLHRVWAPRGLRNGSTHWSSGTQPWADRGDANGRPPSLRW